ncbi:nucleotidyl transferase AbiEii/AbiGii toxin family protein [Variovorax gossypii]
MAAKRTFTPSEWLHLTELVQAAALSGLTASRRWEAGELVFQGGTSLHLIYGSPRFSEDLDFIARSDTGLASALGGSLAHVRASLARQFPLVEVKVKARDPEGAVDPRNPRVFTLTLSEPDWHQALRVKVEFYVVGEQSVNAYGSLVQPVAKPVAPQGAPRFRVDIAPTFIEAAELVEILVDKVHALGDRNRIKERDIFDLWWICQEMAMTPATAAEEFTARSATHFAMYPNGRPPLGLVESYLERAATMRAMLDSGLAPMVEAIGRWLPEELGQPSRYATESAVRAMVEHAIACAEAAAHEMERLAHRRAPDELDAQQDEDDAPPADCPR